MAEYITLLGAEEVSSAANQMTRAASEMQRAAATFDDALRAHWGRMNDWLEQFERVLRETTGDQA